MPKDIEMLLELEYMILMLAGLRHDERMEMLTVQYMTKTNGSYTCTICNRVCRDKYSAKLHLDVHFAPEEGYSCDLCAKVCKSYNSLMAHKTKYHNQ